MYIFFLNIISIHLAFLAFIDGSDSPQSVVVAVTDVHELVKALLVRLESCMYL